MFRTLLIVLAGLVAAPAHADLLISRGAAGVDRYLDDGTFMGTLVSPGAGGLVDAQGVAVLPNGDLLVGDFANDNVLRFDGAGSFLGVFASGPALKTPFDVVLGTDGDVFVANAGGLDTVARLDAGTGAVVDADFTSGNATPIGGPQYLAFGPQLAMTDIAGHVFRFDGTSGNHIGTSFFFVNPEGVAWDEDGVNLYVASFFGVYRVPGGVGPPQLVVDGIDFPQDIAFGPDGSLYVLSDQVYRYDVSGAVGVQVDSFGSGGEFIVHYVPVPEPATWALAGLGLGLAVLAAGRRRRADCADRTRGR